MQMVAHVQENVVAVITITIHKSLRAGVLNVYVRVHACVCVCACMHVCKHVWVHACV